MLCGWFKRYILDTERPKELTAPNPN